MNDPNLTIPPGFGEPRFKRFISSRLDDHFAPQAAQRMHACLEGCRFVMEYGSNSEASGELAFNLAKAAAHWRGLDEDAQRGAVLIEED